MSAFSVLDHLEAQLAPSGIRPRGVVSFGEGEGPETAGGWRARSVILLGNAGGSIWPAFSRWNMAHSGPDPLDVWSKAVIGPVAEKLGAAAFYPSDRPYMPFQQWAMRAEGLTASPLGILIHPVYGLWHGYRGALAFSEAIDGPVARPSPSPCATCADKPCLSSCPVDAVLATGFALAPCRAHLATADGHAGCMVSGCIARNACPAGARYRYSAEQLRFHMAALSG
jgi:ferredoxin